MREDAAPNEAVTLALHEQGSVALVLRSVELPEEGLEVLAHDATKHPMLRARRTYDREIASLVAAV